MDDDWDVPGASDVRHEPRPEPVLYSTHEDPHAQEPEAQRKQLAQARWIADVQESLLNAEAEIGKAEAENVQLRQELLTTQSERDEAIAAAAEAEFQIADCARQIASLEEETAVLRRSSQHNEISSDLQHEEAIASLLQQSEENQKAGEEERARLTAQIQQLDRDREALLGAAQATAAEIANGAMVQQELEELRAAAANGARQNHGLAQQLEDAEQEVAALQSLRVDNELLREELKASLAKVSNLETSLLAHARLNAEVQRVDPATLRGAIAVLKHRGGCDESVLNRVEWLAEDAITHTQHLHDRNAILEAWGETCSTACQDVAAAVEAFQKSLRVGSTSQVTGTSDVMMREMSDLVSELTESLLSLASHVDVPDAPGTLVLTRDAAASIALIQGRVSNRRRLCHTYEGLARRLCRTHEAMSRLNHADATLQAEIASQLGRLEAEQHHMSLRSEAARAGLRELAAQQGGMQRVPDQVSADVHELELLGMRLLESLASSVDAQEELAARVTLVERELGVEDLHGMVPGALSAVVSRRLTTELHELQQTVSSSSSIALLAESRALHDMVLRQNALLGEQQSAMQALRAQHERSMAQLEALEAAAVSTSHAVAVPVDARHPERLAQAQDEADATRARLAELESENQRLLEHRNAMATLVEMEVTNLRENCNDVVVAPPTLADPWQSVQQQPSSSVNNADDQSGQPPRRSREHEVLSGVRSTIKACLERWRSSQDDEIPGVPELHELTAAYKREVAGSGDLRQLCVHHETTCAAWCRQIEQAAERLRNVPSLLECSDPDIDSIVEEVHRNRRVVAEGVAAMHEALALWCADITAAEAGRAQAQPPPEARRSARGVEEALSDMWHSWVELEGMCRDGPLLHPPPPLPGHAPAP